MNFIELVNKKIIDFETSTGIKPNTIYLGEYEMVQVNLFLQYVGSSIDFINFEKKKIMGLKLLEVKAKNHFGLS